MTYHNLMFENQTLFSKMVFSYLMPHALSIGQPKVLEYLSEHDGCMQKDIAQCCMIEPASVTSLLTKMEKDGLVIRKELHNNRRNLYVYLTDLGREKAKYVNEVFSQVESHALDGLSEEEKRFLLELLAKINGNMKDKNI
ncbi:MarR family winged helix-turn-helix transcriptional regulator [Aminipila butyrica]|nr:MarR family transcriptional regulator [Aminipila butyrica]